ncbi:MAG: hypothetical protein QOE17_269 [Gaiellales bacterium]|nr:hypothetical protein [Gaiellales bacterium]
MRSGRSGYLGRVQQNTYIYARLGPGDRRAVLRLAVSGEDQPYPGGDCPTTRSVGPLVIGEVELDEAGHTVLIALDSPRAQDEVRVAVEEGWQQPPSDDPWVSRVHEVNGGDREVAEANVNQGETA